MSESLRNDGRVWVPKKKEDSKKAPGDIAEDDRDYYLERMLFCGRQTSRPATSLHARPRLSVTKVVALAGPASAFIWILRTPSSLLAKARCASVHGNLFAMYHEITNEDAYKTPMRIYPAVHYTMGGCGWTTT